MVSKPEEEADSIPHRGPGGGISSRGGGINGGINGGAKEGGNDDREEHQDWGDISGLTLGHQYGGGDDDDDDGDGDGDGDVFRIPGKNPPTAALRRWRKAALVLNAARRFRYTADLAARAQRKLLKFRASVRAVMVVNQLALIASPRQRELPAPLITVDDNAIAPTSVVVDDVKLAGLARDHDAAALKEAGGVQGVLRYVGIASPDEGVPDGGGELERRRLRFGANTYPRAPPRSFLSFVLDACKDLTLIILMVCAVLTLALGLKTHGTKEGWYDGAAIGFAVLLVVSVTSVSDYRQSLQFSALNDEKRNIKVDVVRAGRRQDVSIFDLVVGDIVVLGIGDQVPADGLLVEGHSLYIDQASLTGESEPIAVHSRSPFLLSGGKVSDGSGSMVVTAVGESTEWGRLMAAIGDDGGDEETPLQVRLNGTATFIGKVGLSVASLVFVVRLIYYFVGRTTGSDGAAFKRGSTPAIDAFNSVVEVFAIAVTIIVVAVPEGLPLAVTLTLAYAMKQMIADKALVRRLSACETMGGATTICSDKTGTLTLNQMSVVKVWAAGGMRDLGGLSSLPDPEGRGAIGASFFEVLFEGIAHNSSGSVFVPNPQGGGGGGEAEVTGSPTEKAALVWGLDMGMDFAAVRSRSGALRVEAFNSMKKKAGVAVRDSRTGKARAHWKGAAEIVLNASDQVLRPDGAPMPMTTDDKIHLMNVIEGMAAKSLRCLAFGYMELDDRAGDPEGGEWKIPEGPLTLLAIVGIKDPCRPEVPRAVRRCQAAGIKVRMITGDNIMTAKAIAAECGILGGGDGGGVAVDGATFRSYSEEERRREAPRIVVMARSSPTDKLLMVQTLRGLGEIVAVTGDGTNDAPALKEADIGLSMGIQGTEVAKESSDIVIMDDNFVSVVKVVRWGRSVYLNIQKFIQFQLTVNVAALTINFVAAMSAGDVPLTAVQLLWVNLIMDTLGALALATERPTDALLDRPPVDATDPLISNVMWRNILSQAAFQITVLLTLQFRGKQILGLESHADANAINKTVIFNAFVFCQIFNEVNARKLEERNVFKGIFAGWLFSAIVLASIVFQIIIVQLLNKFASTVPLEGKYWAISVLIGFVSWPLAFLVKFIPVPKKPILVMKSIRRSKKKKQNLAAAAAAAAAASAESSRKSN